MNRKLKVLVAAACGAALMAGGVAYAAPKLVQAKAPAVVPFTNAPNVIVQTQYVPITPCRIADTRSAAVGQKALENNVQRDYYVSGTANFPAQGGKSGGCGIPFGAAAVSATLTAITPSAGGFLKAWPTGQAEPNAAFANFTTKVNGSTGGTVSVKAAASGKTLTVKDFGGTINLAIDVSGYYIAPIEGLVSPAGTVFSGTSRIISSASTGTGQYQVTVDTDVSYCTPMVTPYPDENTYAIASNYAGTTVSVTVWQLSNGEVTPVDSYFYLYIAC